MLSRQALIRRAASVALGRPSRSSKAVKGSNVLLRVAGRFFASSDIFAPTDSFITRHVGPRDDDISDMLKVVGFDSLDALVNSTVPKHIRLPDKLSLPTAQSEQEALSALKEVASKNKVLRSFIGMGYYNTHTPGVIQRNVLENPGWYTAYTPYQAEVSQGRLEALLNYQTMVCDMTKFAMANASLLDEATAAAEAMNMCLNQSKKRSKFFVSSDCHPQTIAVVQTRAEALGTEVVVGSVQDVNLSSKEFFGILVQYPSTYGDVFDYSSLATTAHDNGTLVVAATDLLALASIKPPAEWGADIAIGNSQRFGVPLFFGGPHAAFLATSEKYSRKMPGRLIGVSVDSNGKKALRMAMQTREQHIRRDKATSNICTAQALLANMAGMYAVYHGPEGIKRIANRVHNITKALAVGIDSVGHEILNETYFDTLHIKLSGKVKAPQVLAGLEDLGINIRMISPGEVGISVDETITKEEVEALLKGFGMKNPDLEELITKSEMVKPIPSNLARKSAFLEHPVFNSHRSETQMMRYLKYLEDKDVGLNRSMIALGSCTMKLNAVSELQPVSWPEFASLHPFVPVKQAEGYRIMIEELHEYLAKITGFAAVSSQPNSEAQGEYAGLLAIRSYHLSRNDAHRNVCLIPVSAHGTNPASAVMAGMKVVVVKSDENGNVDFEDLKANAEKHKNNLAALMITYPSTYGVFEEKVVDMCDLIHSCGGLVYMDGANMNAQVGLTSPGFIGADVCHLNLHKTFCIPHGGGGPGVGSIAVAKHLAPFLPGHNVIETGGEGLNIKKKITGAVSASQYGSPGILPIPYMYIRMTGEEGLRKATSVAILNANYMAKRLENHFEVVYTGGNGQCAHEFIIDIRPFKKFDVTEEDIAKRLQDFGFHSPTMSWPVPGTLMIEPTESEDKEELDRLCEALIIIRGEIKDIEDGKLNHDESPLSRAPHTAAVVLSSEWDRKYSREQAAYPGTWQKEDPSKKFWPTVGRVDNVHGDRNLICTCPPLESYQN